MDRLRPRKREVFTGFTKAEIDKMEKLIYESREVLLSGEFCQHIARCFSRSAGRAGKPVVKWNEVHGWFQTRLQDLQASKSISEQNNELGSSKVPKENKVPDLSNLEFEARSSTDGAWLNVSNLYKKELKNPSEAIYVRGTDQPLYDVDKFLAHRFLSTGEAEVHVRFVGFGAEEDEWVNIKAVRERSIPFEHSECSKVKVGDHVLCFQESRDQAIYYDAYVLEIQRKMHDIRGCRCLFLIRYDHDKSEERVRLRRLYYRPT